MKKVKILIVDDDKDFVRIVSQELTPLGVEIYSAFDGEQATEVIKKQNFQIVILDLMLPKKSGFEILDCLKGSEEKKGKVPFVIITTAIGGRRSQMYAVKYGADKYFEKPFPIIKLIKSVKECLNKLNQPIDKTG